MWALVLADMDVCPFPIRFETHHRGEYRTNLVLEHGVVGSE
jgi:hypothetical protein